MKTFLQERLTGLPGQVVGFSKEGKAEAQYPRGGFMAQLEVTVIRGTASGAVTVTAFCSGQEITGTIPAEKHSLTLELPIYGRWTVTATAETGELLNGSREVAVDAVRQYPVLLGAYETLGKNTPAVICSACAAGLAQRYWKVGDGIDLSLSTGETVTVEIYDFDHDTLTQGGTAAITFGTRHLPIDKYCHHNLPGSSSVLNTKGWAESGVRTIVLPEILKSMPQEWREVIRPVKKLTSLGGQQEGTVTAVDDSLFLFSEEEVFGTAEHAAAGEGKLYSVFTDGSRRIKLTRNGAGGASSWVLRSPLTHHAKSSDKGKFYCSVDSRGTVQAEYSGTLLCFGFCV